MKRFLNLNEEINVNEHASDEEYCCQQMQEAISSNEFSFGYRQQFAETYLISREGISNYWGVDFCPFCGKNIASKFKMWRNVIKEEFGIDTECDDFDFDNAASSLPPEFCTDEWWRKRGL